MHETVRRFAAADAPDVADLQSQARAALTEQRGGPVHLAEVPAVPDWAANAQRTDRAVWVATIDDVVVGYLELALRADRTAEVLQTYVHPEARELGLGDGMLAAATEHARAAGCVALEGTALPGDRDTKNMYERAGVTARRLTVWKAL